MTTQETDMETELPIENKRAAVHVIDFLSELGVSHVFMGPVGHTNLELLEATKGCDDVDTIMTKNELVAGYMACGYYRATHKPGVVSTHTTPGLGNALNQFASSFLNSSAIVDLHTDSPAAWRGRNSHHEIHWGGAYDMSEPVTKNTWDVTDVDKLQEAIPQAFSTALSGCPGPTLVNLPMDVLADSSGEPLPDPDDHLTLDAPAPNDGRVDEAVDQLASTERPVLLAGGGTIISEAAEQLRKFAETVQLPVATTDSAKGIIPEDHELAVGVVGGSGMGSANVTVEQADLVLAVGTRFGEFSTSAWTHGVPFRFPEQDLIQIDINPEEIGRYYPVDIGIVADASETLRALTDVVQSRGEDATAIGSPSFVETAHDAVVEWERKLENYYELDAPLTMGAVVKELRSQLPDDAIVTADSGKNRGEMVKGWETRQPQTMIMDTGNGAMGYGVCAALGAKAGAPDRPVVSVSGDGGFVMVNMVLATAVEYDLPVKWVIMNDQGFVAITGLQEAYFGGEHKTHFTHPDGEPYDIDYIQMAESFNVPAQRAETPDELQAAIDDALSVDEPYLIDARVSRAGPGVDNGAQWVQAGRGTGAGEAEGESAEDSRQISDN